MGSQDIFINPQSTKNISKGEAEKKIEEPNKVIDTFNTSSQKSEEGRSL